MKLTISIGKHGNGGFTVAAKTADRAGTKTRRNLDASALADGNRTESRIAQRQKSAKAQAKRLIQSAWQKDKKVTQDIQDRQDKIQEKLEQNQVRSNQLTDIAQQREALRESYGMDADSQEQKDLELLEKYQNYKNGNFDGEFSKEEIDRLKELQDIPMTQYQKESLELNGIANTLKQEMSQNETSIQQMTEAIREDKNRQLGSQNMLNAQEAADEILEAANEEIMGMLLQEGKDHIDETMEEEKKKAEEVAEKKEEEEEKIEKAKQKREDTEEIIEGELATAELGLTQKVQNEADRQTKELQKQLQKIIQKNHLTEDDLKGIEIDFDF